MKQLKISVLCSSVVMLALVSPAAFATDPPPPSNTAQAAQAANQAGSTKYNVAGMLCSVARLLHVTVTASH